MYSERDIPEMSLSLNCLILGETSFEKIFHVTVADTIISDNIKVPINKAKVGQFKSHIWSTKRNNFSIDNPDDMNLWKVNIDEESKLVGVSTEDDIKEKLEGTKMLPQKLLRRYFPEEPSADSSENVHIIIAVPTSTIELKRKKPITEEEETKGARRWAVYGAILREERYIVYYTDPEGNDKLLEMIRERDYVALYGARASGKSTRVQRIREQLKAEGFNCIYFEHVNIETVEKFWMTLGSSLRKDAKNNIDIKSVSVFGSSNDLKINSADDFLEIFEKSNWNNNVVLLIDEFDKLYEADENVRTSCLDTFRGIKNSKNNYAIWSIVTIGTFSILRLKSERTSPFNEPYQNPNFTLGQVQFLYDQFAKDYNFTIDPAIIEDIYTRTNGHAGLVCLCGRSIFDNLINEIDEDNKLNFFSWLNFAVNPLQKEILEYATFRKMIETFTNKDAKRAIDVKSAIDLLRSRFLGFLDYVPIHDSEELRLVEFLIAEGVLIRDEMTKDRFKMSSALVDELIQQRVIPEVYKFALTVAIPKKDDHSLDILKILQTAIQFFDKNIISKAFNRSFKIAHDLYVGGLKNKLVPRESIYDTELNRILVNWLVKEGGFEVTGQWHLIREDKHTYSNIVITTDCQKIVLELLATATKKELSEHFERVLKYAEQLSADDIWIVHFTCEDDYYTTQKLYWPPNDRKFESVNVVHFFHNKKFENIRMSTRYVDGGSIKYIIDQVIPLQS